MAQKGIREYNAKSMMARYLSDLVPELTYEGKVALVDPETDLEKLGENHIWLKEEKLVVKPDQLFGKRGKNNLLLLDATLEEAISWIEERMEKTTQVGDVTGTLTHFLIEPFVPHDDEYYVAIRSNRDGDAIYFSTSGGVDIEENWDQVIQIDIPALEDISVQLLNEKLSSQLGDKSGPIVSFVYGLFQFFRKLQFTYLEINPFTVSNQKIVPLDTVARLDDTATFECTEFWGDLEFPTSFGKQLSEEEKYISQLDEKSGSSLKLTLLNPEGRVWLMVAGGGGIGHIYRYRCGPWLHG